MGERQLSMFEDRYPDAPGHNWRDTSVQSAIAIGKTSQAVRDQVYDAIKRYGSLTVHECAAVLDLSVPTVQPRFSELAARGLIVDSTLRRVNEVSGKKAIAWRLA